MTENSSAVGNASHRRELSKIASKNGADFGQLGNAAKMRETLILVQKKINYLIGSLTVPNSLVSNRMEINGIINAALAATPRNCDVGTAEEQAERYGRYCDKFTSDGMHCETCPCCGKIPLGKCEFAWMQMPYNESEATA